MTALRRFLAAPWAALLLAAPGAGQSPSPVLRVWKEPFTGERFIHIPAGRFLMGSPPDEPGHREDEIEHGVTLTRGFWMGRCEVTQGDWNRVMGTGEPHPGKPSPFRAGDPRYPVMSVSYEDVARFLHKLDTLSPGNHFRLPTEAEWEYACRAGSTTAYATGARLTGAQARIKGSHPAPVGSYPPNAWGLCDLHGNAWEWTSDWYGPYPASPVLDPQGASTGTLKVIRGGSWAFGEDSARSADRYTHAPGDWGYSLGFRIIREPLAPAGSP